MRTKNPAFLISVAAACAALGPATVAFSTPKMTQKQAALQGVTVTRKVQEQMVDKLIVRMRSGKSSSLAQPMSAQRVQALSVTAGVGMKKLRTMAGGSQLMQLDRPMTVSQARAVAARLAQESDVQYAEPNTWFKKLATPNEPRYTQWQWNLFDPTADYTGVLGAGTVTTKAVGGANLPTAWDLTIGTSEVTIAIIDTGMTNHTDLNGVASAATYVPSGRFLPGYDFISSTSVASGAFPANFVANDGNGRDADASDPGDWITVADKTAYEDCRDPDEVAPYTTVDSSWHGTHMAGIAAATANNSVGIAGVGWNVRIVPVRTLGKCGGDLADIVDAIQWSAGLTVPNVPANANPAQVISLSLGGGDTCSPEMQSAVDAAIAEGSVVVAASGNAGQLNTLISPANCMNVVAVTAHTINGENADYANIGAGVTLSAPGGGTPVQLGMAGTTDNTSFDGYYIHSAVLFGPTTPTSATAAGSTGPAYAGFTGTSAATPHVAGVVALIKSAYPAATPAQIESFLRTTAAMRPFPAGSACEVGMPFDGMCGAGLLDARLAVAAVGDNGIPMANAGDDQVVAPGSAVTLNGTKSTAFPNRTINANAWSQLTGSAVTLANANTPTASFSAPSTGTLTFRLRVTDDQGKTGDDVALVRVNSAPVLAAAPAAQSAVVGAVVAFTVAATDADNNPLTFSAAAQSTVPVTTLSPTGQFSWNTAGAAPGSYELTYFATDGTANSAMQTVAITLTPGASAVPPTGGGGGGGGGDGGGGALPWLQLLLLGALLTSPSIRQRK